MYPDRHALRKIPQIQNHSLAEELPQTVPQEELSPPEDRRPLNVGLDRGETTIHQ